METLGKNQTAKREELGLDAGWFRNPGRIAIVMLVFGLVLPGSNLAAIMHES